MNQLIIHVPETYVKYADAYKYVDYSEHPFLISSANRNSPSVKILNIGNDTLVMYKINTSLWKSELSGVVYGKPLNWRSTGVGTQGYIYILPSSGEYIRYISVKGIQGNEMTVEAHDEYINDLPVTLDSDIKVNSFSLSLPNNDKTRDLLLNKGYRYSFRSAIGEFDCRLVITAVQQDSIKFNIIRVSQLSVNNETNIGKLFNMSNWNSSLIMSGTRCYPTYCMSDSGFVFTDDPDRNVLGIKTAPNDDKFRFVETTKGWVTDPEAPNPIMNITPSKQAIHYDWRRSWVSRVHDFEFNIYRLGSISPAASALYSLKMYSEIVIPIRIGMPEDYKQMYIDNYLSSAVNGLQFAIVDSEAVDDVSDMDHLVPMYQNGTWNTVSQKVYPENVATMFMPNDDHPNMVYQVDDHLAYGVIDELGDKIPYCVSLNASNNAHLDRTTHFTSVLDTLVSGNYKLVAREGGTSLSIAYDVDKQTTSPRVEMYSKFTPPLRLRDSSIRTEELIMGCSRDSKDYYTDFVTTVKPVNSIEWSDHYQTTVGHEAKWVITLNMTITVPLQRDKTYDLLVGIESGPCDTCRDIEMEQGSISEITVGNITATSNTSVSLDTAPFFRADILDNGTYIKNDLNRLNRLYDGDIKSTLIGESHLSTESDYNNFYEKYYYTYNLNSIQFNGNVAEMMKDFDLYDFYDCEMTSNVSKLYSIDSYNIVDQYFFNGNGWYDCRRLGNYTMPSCDYVMLSKYYGVLYDTDNGKLIDKFRQSYGEGGSTSSVYECKFDYFPPVNVDKPVAIYSRYEYDKSSAVFCGKPRSCKANLNFLNLPDMKGIGGYWEIKGYPICPDEYRKSGGTFLHSTNLVEISKIDTITNTCTVRVYDFRPLSIQVMINPNDISNL